MARLAFLGTPEAAVPTLEALLAAGHEIALVVSRPDRRRGRGGSRSASPVKAAALERGLTVTDSLDDVVDLQLDLGVVVAYGRLIPDAVLDRLELLNVHFSLLPRWRGAAPVERAILAGDRRTGVCLMRIVTELDAGAVLARREIEIGDDDAETVRDRLAALGAAMTVELLATGASPLPAGEPQQGVPTYAEKIRPEELELHWHEPAEQLLRVVRLGRAWTTFRGRRLRIRSARLASASDAATSPEEPDAAPSPRHPGDLTAAGVVTGTTLLIPEAVQGEGGRIVPYGEWLHGARPRPGERLGT